MTLPPRSDESIAARDVPASVRRRQRRMQWCLFAAAFVTFAYFHQGGGWNQNARFAMVRAMVEARSLAIDDFLVYAADAPDGAVLRRVPITGGTITRDGAVQRLVWRTPEGRVVPLGRRHGVAHPEVPVVGVEEVAASGDVAFAGAHFHPNKAPGTAWLAVPAYALVHMAGRLLGANPDGWWPLTVGAWLTTVFSVGLLSACGCLVFFRLALAWSGRPLASLLATLSLAFGTMYFAYATMLHEHNIVAVGLLASFACLYAVKRRSASGGVDRATSDGRVRMWLMAGGGAAGYAAITNYIVAAVVALLACYALAVRRKPSTLAWFGLGLLAPLALILTYNVVCFGTPFTTNYQQQNPLFRSAGWLGVFQAPDVRVLVAVLVSPYRGLFVSAPVLLLGLYGIARLVRRPDLRTEAWLLVAIVAWFLIFIMSYNAWHGGWGVAPRYLLPAVAFLGLPMVLAFARWRRLSIALAAVSVTINLMVTAVDPQSPVGNGQPGTVPGRPSIMERPVAMAFAYSPVTEYIVPFFVSGRPTRWLHAMAEGTLALNDRIWEANGIAADDRRRHRETLRRRIESDIAHGNPDAFWVGSFEGPLSVNPIGIYEGRFYALYGAHSPQARWNAFNAGELIAGNRLLSLVPLLLVWIVLVGIAGRDAAALERLSDGRRARR